MKYLSAQGQKQQLEIFKPQGLLLKINLFMCVKKN